MIEFYNLTAARNFRAANFLRFYKNARETGVLS